MKYQSLFRALDNFFFDKIPSLSTFPPYEWLQDFLGNLDDEKRSLVTKLISWVLILIPIIATSFFILKHFSLKNDLETRKKLYHQAHNLIAMKKGFQQTQKKFLSPSSPKNKSALESKVKYILRRRSINTQNIKVQNFIDESFPGGIKKNTATLIFNDFKPRELTAFLNDIIHNEKMKIYSLDIQRKESHLEGKIPITYLTEGN